MGFKRRGGTFNDLTLLTGGFVLLMIIAQHLMVAPIVGMDLAYWFVILVVVVLASLQMPKIVYGVIMGITIIAFLITALTSLGTAVGVAQGMFIISLLLFAIAVLLRYLGTKK